MKLFSKMLLPLIIVFAGTVILIFAATGFWQSQHIDIRVLLGADALFLAVSILVFFIQAKALTNPNPNVFIRSITIGMLIKMFSTVIAVLLYTTMAGAAFDSKAVFISLFIYLLYLAAEVMAISKVNRKKNA
jgi:hypothetical protein